MIDGEGAKRCSRCKQDKPRAAFAHNKAMRYGLRAYCRECSASCSSRTVAGTPAQRPPMAFRHVAGRGRAIDIAPVA